MDELLRVIELSIVTSPQHIIDKSFKVQESPLLLKKVTFETTKNIVEYEDLVMGLRAIKNMNI